jgi:hypothetical protein
MTLKAFLAAAAAIAVAVGLALPVPHKADAQPATRSQLDTISIGHG